MQANRSKPSVTKNKSRELLLIEMGTMTTF